MSAGAGAEEGGSGSGLGAGVPLLPALFGGLTLLLARRRAGGAAAAGGGGGSGVSRRRRIGREPPGRRPPPLPPPAAAPPPVAAPPVVAPPPPKHIPFPPVPADGDALFEALALLLTLAAAALAYLQLYRTVWWLPHSHTDRAVNFYLIDGYVVALIAVMLSRRLVMCACSSTASRLLPPGPAAALSLPIRMFALGVLFGGFFWCLYFVAKKYPPVNLLYLSYPLWIYLLMFGRSARPLLGGERPAPLHGCSADAAAVRAEIHALKADFNERMKDALFASMSGAYYSSFVPCCFAQAFVRYDAWWCAQQTLALWLGLFAWRATHAFPAWYCDVLHRAALHGGGWAAAPATRAAAAGAPAWCARALWPRGAVVRRGERAFVALGRTNAAEPGDAAGLRFYRLFRDPSAPARALLCLQLALALAQLLLLFSTTEWQRVVSVAVLLFANYYALFKLARDYLVAWRVYRAERDIAERAERDADSVARVAAERDALGCAS